MLNRPYFNNSAPWRIGYKFATFGNVLVAVTLIFFICFGYGFNIYKLSQCDFKAPYKTEVIRLLGVIIFPVGTIVGYLQLEDK